VNTLTMVGLSHRRSSLALLERVAVRRGEQGAFLTVLREAGYPQAIVLSTCSRTEIYVSSVPAANDLLEVLAGYAQCPEGPLKSAAEIRTGRAAVEHLFRVAGGLESRVVGEVEIRGQVRAALRSAIAAGTASPALRRLFAAALKAANRVRLDTALGTTGRSLAYQAVDTGLARVDGAADPTVVVVGSGRMAGAAVEHLGQLNRRPQVAARNELSAARLAGADRVCPLSALADGLEQADLVICATSAAEHVVTLAQVRQAMSVRSERPLTIVDLSVPRNVDVRVASVPGVHLIDLEGVNDDGNSDPELAAALETGTMIVTSAVDSYLEDVAAADVGPIIAAIRGHVEATCLRELMARPGTEAHTDDDLARAAHAIAGKLLHAPTIAARAAAANGDVDLDELCRIFGVRPSDLDVARALRRAPAEVDSPMLAPLQASCA
jgi:glutamyl-tRNA reductase